MRRAHQASSSGEGFFIPCCMGLASVGKGGKMWKCHLLISSRLRNCPCGSFLLLPHIAASAANLGKANLPFSPTQIYVFIVFSSATDVH